MSGFSGMLFGSAGIINYVLVAGSRVGNVYGFEESTATGSITPSKYQTADIVQLENFVSTPDQVVFNMAAPTNIFVQNYFTQLEIEIGTPNNFQIFTSASATYGTATIPSGPRAGQTLAQWLWNIDPGPILLTDTRDVRILR